MRQLSTLSYISSIRTWQVQRAEDYKGMYGACVEWFSSLMANVLKNMVKNLASREKKIENYRFCLQLSVSHLGEY